MTEVPLFFLIVWVSLHWMPRLLIAPYELFLLILGPVLTVLEAIAAMELILQIGPLYGEQISQFSTAAKVFILLGCGAAFGACGSLIGWLLTHHHSQGTLTPTGSALVTATCTLVGVFTFATVVVSEHGLVTDAALLAVYVCYDLVWIMSEWPWEMARKVTSASAGYALLESLLLAPVTRVGRGIYYWMEPWVPRKLWASIDSAIGFQIEPSPLSSSSSTAGSVSLLSKIGTAFSNWRETMHALVWFQGPLTHVHSLLATLLGLLNIAILVHVSVQLVLFGVGGNAVRHAGVERRFSSMSNALGQAKSRRGSADNNDDQSGGEDEGTIFIAPEEESTIPIQWIVSRWWPSYSKSLLVLVYTYSWLMQERRDDIHLHDLTSSSSSILRRLVLLPSTSRWINVLLVMAIYTKHLMTPYDIEGIHGSAMGGDGKYWEMVNRKEQE